MLNDDHLSAVTDYITRMYRNKSRFLSDLRSRFNVDLSSNSTYKAAIANLIIEGKEKEFSLALFNA